MFVILLLGMILLWDRLPFMDVPCSCAPRGGARCWFAAAHAARAAVAACWRCVQLYACNFVWRLLAVLAGAPRKFILLLLRSKQGS